MLDKRLVEAGVSILEELEVATLPKYWAGGSWGRRGSWERWNIIITYHCTGYMFESGNFW